MLFKLKRSKAMAQKANGIRTSRGVARTASKVLSNPHSSHSAKRLAASTLSNRGR